MKYVIRKVPERDTTYLEKLIPGALVYSDEQHEGPIKSFVAAMKLADDDAVYIQDDMILCRDFTARCEREIEKYGNDVIEFSNFTCYEGDTRVLTAGYYDPMRVQWVLCLYIPKRISSLFVQQYEAGMIKPNKYELSQQSDDVLFCKFLKGIGELSYLVVPNLAGHPRNHSQVNVHRDREIRMCMNFEYDKAVPNGDMSRELRYYQAKKPLYDQWREAQMADQAKKVSLW